MKDREYATPFTMLHAASLLSHRSRLDKFKQAIQQVVKEGDYVVDIGTGSGVLAIFAAKAGARSVSAIDINPESLSYAKKAAQMNSVGEVIEFIEGSYSEFKPKERADVVICEMLSSMMLVEQQIPASIHALENILKPGGVILPCEITVYTVPVECSIIWDRFQYENLQFPRVVQSITPEATRDLADLNILVNFHIMKLHRESKVDRTLHFTILESGTIHGLVGVFESKLHGNIYLKMEDGWKQLFLPLNQPIEVKAGDMFSTRIFYRPGEFDSLSIKVL